MSVLPKLRPKTQKLNTPAGPIENIVTMTSLSTTTGATENIDGNQSLTEEAPECAICLSQYEIEEIVAWSKLKGGCTHVFHYECIFEWAMNGHSHCPVCRTAFWSRNRKKVDKMPREASVCKNILCCTPLCSLLRDNSHTDQAASSDGPETLVSNSSDDVVVTVHTAEAAANSSLPVLSEAPEDMRQTKDEQCIKKKVYSSQSQKTKIERSHFCVLHGLISPPDSC